MHPCQPKNAPVELGAIKTLLARYGINSRGWRLYLDYGDALFSPLSRPWIHPDQPFSSGPNAIAYLRILQACEMDVLPPPTLVASLARWELPDERLDRLPPLFFRAAWKAVVANSYPSYPSCKQCSPEDFVEKEVLPVALLLRQQLWAQEQEALAPPQKLPLGDEWNPYVRRVEWGAYRFEALTNAEQLLAEGAAMQHCVGSFADYCRSGLKRIYSVRERKSGQRVATFSLEYADDGGEFLVWK
ncbi:PcfJ domain-containing protein, partial [bacterium]|nr:PcfJ domain-containing protein [bacterium]